MDELDALFAGNGSRSGGAAPTARGTPSSGAGRVSVATPVAPWDDGIPMAPHPSEVGSARGVGGQTGRPGGGEDRVGGTARLTQPVLGAALATSVVRTSTPRVAPGDGAGGNVAHMPERARPTSVRQPQDDVPPMDWHGGEEERGDGPPQGGREKKKEDYFSCHVYGGKASLCFNADTTRSDNHTVRLESAPSKGPRSYDWDRKVAIQFTVKEMPFVLAVFMGWLPSVQFTAHGPKQDKGFSFEHQNDKVFARVWQGKDSQMAVPVFAEDMFAVVDVLLRQMVKNSPHLGVEGVIAVVRQLSAQSYQHRGLEVKKPPSQRAAAA